MHPVVRVLRTASLLLVLTFGASVSQFSSGEAQAAPPPANAHPGLGMSLAFRSSLLGFGLEAEKLLGGHIGARVGYSYMSFSANHTQSDISYAASLKISSFEALADFYPGAFKSFHLTGGIATNPLTISGKGVTNSGSFKINGHSYTADQVGTLSADGKFPSVSPYLGIGTGTPARGGPIEFLFDLGAVLGKPTINLGATGAASNPQLASDLQAQSQTTQHDVRKYLKVYPVLSFGIGYRF